jgi:hypothetical protein
MSCSQTFRVVALTCAIALAPALARASTVNFDSFPTLDTCPLTLSSEGLDFAQTGSVCMGVWAGNPNSNGTPGLILGFTGQVSTTQTGGGPFDLNSLEMAISWYETARVSTVDVTAHFHGGGTSTETLTLIPSLQTYALNLLDVDRVDFSALSTAGGYWVMDNIDFSPTPVPEPVTGLLVASGLAMGALRRRRRV